MTKTKISWATHTLNWARGCSKVSEGCRNCYAERISLKNGWTAKEWTAANAAENVRVLRHKINEPLGARQPIRYFVNSMADTFHDLIPDAILVEAFKTMKICDWHTFIILTKRPQRMHDWMREHYPEPLKNVWLGVSVENQKMADTRIPLLVDTPAFVRFLSCEPLLGSLNLVPYLSGLQWVIVGGESGPDFRQMKHEWAADILGQCRIANVPFFGKQVSGPKSEVPLLFDGVEIKEYPVEDSEEPPEQMELF